MWGKEVGVLGRQKTMKKLKFGCFSMRTWTSCCWKYENKWFHLSRCYVRSKLETSARLTSSETGREFDRLENPYDLRVYEDLTSQIPNLADCWEFAKTTFAQTSLNVECLLKLNCVNTAEQKRIHWVAQLSQQTEYDNFTSTRRFLEARRSNENHNWWIWIQENDNDGGSQRA